MSELLVLLLPATIAAVFTYSLTPAIARLANRVGAIDVPNSRKVHLAPVPRLGGLAVVTSIAAVWVSTGWIYPEWQLASGIAQGVGFGVLPIFIVSIVDDIRGVAPRIKFLCHLVGALIAVSSGISLDSEVHLMGQSIQLGWTSIPLSVLWMVGVTNAFNVIDGLDGLSAGLALIAATSMAAVFAMVNQPEMTAAALVLAGALAGFLPFNIHPARLFLGDTGATAIGFCLAAFALKGGSTLSTGFAALIPVFVMGLPIADTLITMARRLIRRMERRGSGGVFDADRNHIHHRLLALGVSHANAVLILYVTGIVFASAAFISIFLTVREAAMFVVALTFAGFVGMHRLGYDEFAFLRRGAMLKAYEAPVFERAMFTVFVDIALIAAAAYISIGLKFDIWNPLVARRVVSDLVGTVAPLAVIVFWRTGMYRGSWTLASLDDLVRACGSAVAVTALAIFVHAAVSADAQPWTLFLIYGFVSLVLLTGSRASYVVLRNSYRHARTEGTPLLIYGAGTSGIAAVRQVFDNPSMQLRPIGFIDDRPEKAGKLLYGLPVLGTSNELTQIIRNKAAGALLIAIPQLSVERHRQISTVCEELGTTLLRMQVRMEVVLGSKSEAEALNGTPQLETPAPHQPDPLEIGRRALGHSS